MILTKDAVVILPIYMVADSDQTDPTVPLVTPMTGVTVTAYISKNGGAFAATSGSVTEIGNGWYKVTLTATETNTAGPLIVRATGTNCNTWNDYHEVTAGVPATDVTLDSDEYETIADTILNRDISDARDSGVGDTPGDYSVNTALHALLNMAQDESTPTSFNIKDKNGATIATISVDFAAAGSTGASSFAPI